MTHYDSPLKTQTAALRFLLLTFAVTASATSADDRPVDFGRDVYRVLQKACIECHGPKKQEGDFRLDRAVDLQDSGAVVAGEPDDSELLRRISLSKGHDEVMPAIGDPLTKSQVDAIPSFPGNTEKPIVYRTKFQQDVLWIAVYGDASERELKEFAKNLSSIRGNY